jgi:hypothetical protein
LRAPVAVERLGLHRSARERGESRHRHSSTRQKRATRFRSAEPVRRGDRGARARLSSQRRRRGPAVRAPQRAEQRVDPAVRRSGRRDTIAGRPSAGARGSGCSASPSRPPSSPVTGWRARNTVILHRRVRRERSRPAPADRREVFPPLLVWIRVRQRPARDARWQAARRRLDRPGKSPRVPRQLASGARPGQTLARTWPFP